MLQRIFLVAFAILAGISVHAQPNTYGHEWINFGNDQPTLKIKVLEEGIYRVDFDRLNAAFNQTSTSLSEVDPQHFALYNKGKQVPVYISGESDGSFDSGDFIEFYGEGNDGWFDQFLYEKPNHRPNKYHSNFSDTAIYFLTIRSNPSFTKKRLEPTNNDVSNPGPQRQYFMHKQVAEYHGNWNGGHATRKAGVYLYSPDYSNGEGFLSGTFNKSTLTRNIPLDGIFANGPIQQAKVKTNLVSYFDNEHRIRFSINNQVQYDTSYIGQGVKPLTSSINVNQLNAKAENEFRYEALGTQSSDRNAIGFIEITYPHNFDFNSARFYDFKMNGPRNNTAYFEIDNFDHQGNAPILIDVRNQTRLQGDVNGSTVRFNLPFPKADTAELYLTAQSDIKTPEDIGATNLVDLAEPANQGDYVMIYHPSLTNDGSGNNWIEEYYSYRQSMAGGNRDVVKLSTSQVYDQFGYGIDRHPMAIKNLVKFMLDSFNVLVKDIFLIGKGVEYQSIRQKPNWRSISKIPPFGHPGGDMSYSMNTNDRPMMAIGRVSARNGREVFHYLEKVKALEANQNAPAGQSLEDKNWMKNVLHFGGGDDKAQQDLIKQYLYSYQDIINNINFGGRVFSFFKTSADPIQYVQSQYLDSIITNGVSLITFFGHSSQNSFDINLDKPENYENFGKTPVLISNGCFSGQIFGPGRGISEKFILQPEGGAIGFLASTSYGELRSLHTYSTKLYENLTKNQYNNGFATSVMHTVRHVLDTISPNIFLRYLARQNTYHGDPAIRINGHEKPDYAIEPPYVNFEPSNVSVDQDSFTVAIHIHNIGKAIKDQYTVEVRRTFPDGSFKVRSKEVDATFSDDTVRLTFYTDPVKGVNRNDFEVIIDSNNEIDELSEMNNSTNVSLNIRSREAFPVYPYNYSIAHGDVTLKATTSDLLSGINNYQVELDTTRQFNSPIKKTTIITSQGGVLEWDHSSMNFQDEMVYYWRVSPEFTDPDSAAWNSSSFTYSDEDITGWNQSHFHQLTDNDLNNLQYEGRKLAYIDDNKELRATNGIYNYVQDIEVSAFFINGSKVHAFSCVGNGIVIGVIDSVTGLPWEIEDYNFGETHCGPSGQRGAFTYPTNGNVNQRKKVVDMLDTIPKGNYVIIMSFQRPDYKAWKNDTAILGTSIFEKMTQMGANNQLAHIDTFDQTRSFIFFAKKGYPQTAHSVITPATNALIDTTFLISGKWSQGFVKSTTIGPAKSYQELSWNAELSNDPVERDHNYLKVRGQSLDELQQKILINTQQEDTSLVNVDASIHPKLQLQFHTEDDSFRTASQLRQWRVLYDPVGDVAVNPARVLERSTDTLKEGEAFSFKVALENVTNHDMDSLLVALHHVDANNKQTLLWEKRYRPLPGQDTLLINFEKNTLGNAGRNTLILEANPGGDQMEQHTFNNTINFPYLVQKDRENPLLDVTFDGVRIMDGDIVSAKPTIRVRLEDENQHLLLNDTTLMNLFIHYPNGNKQRIPFSDPNVTFTPAVENGSSSDNEAEITYHATFKTDGRHELEVRASDKSGNRSGNLDYRIGFRVINETMISNVFNYPNPFTSSTQFVFTLTGSEVPQNIRIQIMTVTGRVVREITKDELGPLHIGTNITEFRWNGTDEFGDPLANGLYLYRVFSADNQGQDIKNFKLEGNADRFFENGIGKMYLAR